MVKVVLHSRAALLHKVRQAGYPAMPSHRDTRLTPLLGGLFAGKEVPPARPYSWGTRTACTWLHLKSVQCLSPFF